MLNKYDRRYKEYLKLNTRYNELRDLIRKVPKIQLDKPFQRGWVIKYELRADIKRRKDAGEILYLLETGYHRYYYTSNVNTVKAVRRGEKFIEKIEKGKKIRISLSPGRRHLTEQEYEKIPDKLKQYFYLDTFSEVYRRWGRKFYLIVIPEYWLVLKARPNMVHSLRGKASDLETEYTEVYHKLQHLWNVYLVNYSSSHPAHKDRVRIRAAIQNFKNTYKGSYDLIDSDLPEIYNDKIPKEYDW